MSHIKHLISEVEPSKDFDVIKLMYPRDKFVLISVDKIRTFRFPYKKQITGDGKIKEYTRDVQSVLITVRCRKCGTVKQVVDSRSLGCKNGSCSSWWKDLTNKRFGRLVAVSYEYVSYRKGSPKRWYWKCKCDCGNFCYKTAHDLLNTGTHECPGCSVRTKRFKQILPENGAAWNQAYTTVRHNAKVRDYSFELTMEQFQALCKKPCYYCGADPSMPMFSGRDKSKPVAFRNGVDRFDNTKGYTVDNCVPCCFSCNQMKSSYSYNDWLKTMRNILEHCEKRSTTISKESTLKRVETDSPEREDIV